MLKTAGCFLGIVATFAVVLIFIVRASDTAAIALGATKEQETRLRAVETTLPAMAADIKAIRDIIERELNARKTPSKGRSEP